MIREGAFLKKRRGLLISGKLGGRKQDPSINEPGENLIHVILECMSFCNGIADQRKLQLIINLLKEKIADL